MKLKFFIIAMLSCLFLQAQDEQAIYESASPAELAGVIKIQSVEIGVKDHIIDSLSNQIAVIRTPVSNQDGASNVFGAIIGLVSFLVTRVLFKVTPVRQWVEEKWSKSYFTIAVGGLVSALFIAVVSATSHVSLGQAGMWLLMAWGTHFSSFTLFVEKPKA